MRLSSPLVPLIALICAMVSIQSSASLAKELFLRISPQAVTALRLLFSALVLLLFFRPWRSRMAAGAWKPIAAYGVALGCMNLTFYLAIARIPLGLAVALEFTGPLVIAGILSRSWREYLWLGLAVVGIIPLLPLGAFSSDLDPVGVGFALGAGFFWALYIVFGKKAAALEGAMSVALGTVVAACLILPVGLASEGVAMFAPAVLPYAFLVGVFSSALPYALEMFAMSRMSAQNYGVLTSMEPALAALSGFIFLGESLSLGQWAAMACVMAASLGTALGGRR